MNRATTIAICFSSLLASLLDCGGGTGPTNSCTGALGFSAKVDYPTGGTPLSVAAADLNGDGRPELAVANSYPDNTASVLLNNGNGTFAARVDYTTGAVPFVDVAGGSSLNSLAAHAE